MILADTFGSVLVAVGITVVLAAAVGFWLLSRVAPRGTVLVVAIAVYVVAVVGSVLSAGDSRVLLGITGILKFSGFVGVVLGLVDLFRGRRSRSANRASHLSALQQSLGASPRSAAKSSKTHERNQP